MQGRRKVGAGGALAPQSLAEQLTLSQPGGQIMPTTVLRAPPLTVLRFVVKVAVWDIS